MEKSASDSAKYLNMEKETILLGLIAEEPIHSYGLKEKIRDRQMHLWTKIGFSSIYRVVKKLEAKRLVEAHHEHIGQGSTRKVYTITTSGHKELEANVLALLSSLAPQKNPFCVGLVNITQASYDAVLANLEMRMAKLKTVERELEETERSFQKLIADREVPAAESRIEHTFQYQALLRIKIVFSHTKRHARAERESVEEIIQILKEEGSVGNTYNWRGAR